MVESYILNIIFFFFTNITSFSNLLLEKFRQVEFIKNSFIDHPRLIEIQSKNGIK
jgi:hypothetical protein